MLVGFFITVCCCCFVFLINLVNLLKNRKTHWKIIIHTPTIFRFASQGRFFEHRKLHFLLFLCLSREDLEHWRIRIFSVFCFDPEQLAYCFHCSKSVSFVPFINKRLSEMKRLKFWSLFMVDKEICIRMGNISILMIYSFVHRFLYEIWTCWFEQCTLCFSVWVRCLCWIVCFHVETMAFQACQVSVIVTKGEKTCLACPSHRSTPIIKYDGGIVNEGGWTGLLPPLPLPASSCSSPIVLVWQKVMSQV